jgi:hypothetical protein
LARSNALDVYRRVIRLKLMFCLMIALMLILIGIYYLLTSGR